MSRLLLLALGATACAPPVISVEVLPPRTSITCAAPGPDDPALGRGLLDAKATADVHGGYLADLRLVVPGVNVRVDGVSVTLTRDGTVVKAFPNVPVGDVALVGDANDVRKAVVENVELVPRSIATDLAADDTISALEFATLVAEIAPLVIGKDANPAASTFALDVCNGCLVTPPTAAQCPGGTPRNPVCRVGQDVPLFSCLSGAAP